TMSQGFVTQNSPRDRSTSPGAGTEAPRLKGCDTTACQTQFHPSGSSRERLIKPQVAKMSSQPSLSRSIMAGPYDQPTSATCISPLICSNSRPPRLRCNWRPVVNEGSLARIGSGYDPGQRLPMTRLPALEYMLPT